MRILIADDDPGLTQIIAEALYEARLTPDVANTAAEASRRLHENDYDVAVLDWNFDGEQIEGVDLVHQIYETGRDIPILMMTGRGHLMDRVTGLNGGADDYLPKPFHMPELLARVKALLRRGRLGKPKGRKITIGSLEIDTNELKVHLREQEIFLNNKEFQLLRYLMEKQNTIVGRTELLAHIWNDNDIRVTSNTIEVHVKRLRRKLTDYGRFIRTVRGIGYRFQI